MVDKLTVVPVTGANNITNINDNFNKIERVINQEMLSRKVAVGQPNQLLSPIDANGQRLYNLPNPQTDGEPITFKYLSDVQNSVIGTQEALEEAQRQVNLANAATAQANALLLNTEAALDDVSGTIATQRDQAIGQINTASSVILADMSAKQSDVATKASQVSTNTGLAQTAATNAMNSANAAAASAASAGLAGAIVNGSDHLIITRGDGTQYDAGNVRGPQGIQGIQGIQGPEGPKGDTGDTGPAGITNLAIANRTTTSLDVTSSTGTAATLPQVTTTLAGLISSTDKVKLNGVATGATANATDAALRDRSTHTGTQLASTISNILGTVSQSGGVPTGAIIQSGRNANGGFIRYADGTQICYQRIQVASRSYPVGSAVVAAQWTFPITFSPYAPAMTCSIFHTWTHWFNYGWESISPTGAANLGLRNNYSSELTTALDIHAIAIGRWFE